MLTSLSNLFDFAPQFHLSLQSGDDFILKKMNRKYTAEQYYESCKLIYKYFPDANITTDIIVGFPYEKEENFINTMNLAKKVKFGKIHCFPFSAKKGTIAYNYEDVDAETKKLRMDQMTKLSQELMREYNAKFIDRTLDMLIEEVEDGFYVGYSGNYIKCYLPVNNSQDIGKIIKVKGIKIFKEGLMVG